MLKKLAFFAPGHPLFQVILTFKILLYKRKRRLTRNLVNEIPKSKLKVCLCIQYGRLYIEYNIQKAQVSLSRLQWLT